MGKPSGESQSLQNSQENLANQMAATGAQSAAEGGTLFNLALPGLEQSESYYGKLASGDPNALARANAPAIQQIDSQSQAAKKNIVQDTPRGGERNLALEEADITKGAQTSQLTTGSYTGSFGSLAGLGGQNVSQGTSATATGLQGMNSAANQFGQLGQLQNEQKATQMGFIGSLAGAGAEAYGACYVAAVLYGGWLAPETMAIRLYLYRYAAKHWLGGHFYAAYCKHGKAWARHIQTHGVSRWFAARLFAVLLRRARRARCAAGGV